VYFYTYIVETFMCGNLISSFITCESPFQKLHNVRNSTHNLLNELFCQPSDCTLMQADLIIPLRWSDKQNSIILMQQWQILFNQVLSFANTVIPSHIHYVYQQPSSSNLTYRKGLALYVSPQSNLTWRSHLESSYISAQQLTTGSL